MMQFAEELCQYDAFATLFIVDFIYVSEKQ